MASYTKPERITRMFEKYDPPKLAVLAPLLKKFEGKEDELLSSLVKKYGPEPPDGPITPTPVRSTTPPGGSKTPPAARAATPPGKVDPKKQLADALRTFYQKHDPDKVDAVDAMAEKYVGKESKLHEAFKKKYGSSFEIKAPAAAEAAPVTDEAKLKDVTRRLYRFFKHYDAAKANTVPAIASKYADKPSAIFSVLEKKYGPEADIPASVTGDPPAAAAKPPAATAADAPTSQTDVEEFAGRIRAFYEEHDAQKAAEATNIAKKYAGKEKELFAAMTKKYGKCPPPAGQAPVKPKPAAPVAEKKPEAETAKPAQQPAASSAPGQKHVNSNPIDKSIDLKTRLQDFYSVYDTEKCDKIDGLVTKYAGNEEPLWKAIFKKYSYDPAKWSKDGGSHQKPAAVSKPQTAGDPEKKPTASKPNDKSIPLKQRLIDFYSVHDPAKCADAENIAFKYSDNEEPLWTAIFRKYKVKPPSPIRQPTPEAAPEPEPVVEPKKIVKRERAKTVAVVNTEERMRLMNFFRAHDPSRQAEVDSLLAANEDPQALEKLFKDLVERYGPEPPPFVATEEDYAALEKRLRAFYVKYDASKLSEVPRMVKQYAGTEFDLFNSLTTKYGPEPVQKAPQPVPKLSTGVPELPQPKARQRSRARSIKITITPERTRLCNFFRKYDEQRLLDVDAILAEYEGQEEELFQQLVEEYGPEPGEYTITDEDKDKLRRRLRAFYLKYDESKLADLELRVEKYVGHEADLFKALEEKYGPEPQEPQQAPPPPEEEVDIDEVRHRVERMLMKYDQAKLQLLDTLMSTFQGREGNMLKTLVTRYGPEPAPDEDLSQIAPREDDSPSEPPVSKMHRRLERFYQRYDPQKLANLNSIVEQFSGSEAKEEALMKALTSKYGPELLPPEECDGEPFWFKKPEQYDRLDDIRAALDASRLYAAMLHGGVTSLSEQVETKSAQFAEPEIPPPVSDDEPEDVEHIDVELPPIDADLLTQAAIAAGQWAEKEDPKSKRKYAYNPQTKETTWDLKKLLLQKEEKRRAEELPKLQQERKNELLAARKQANEDRARRREQRAQVIADAERARQAHADSMKRSDSEQDSEPIVTENHVEDVVASRQGNISTALAEVVERVGGEPAAELSHAEATAVHRRLAPFFQHQCIPLDVFTLFRTYDFLPIEPFFRHQVEKHFGSVEEATPPPQDLVSGTGSSPAGTPRKPVVSARDKRRLERFYAQYAPEKQNSVEETFAAFDGTTEDLFRTLVRMHGPEPEVPPEEVKEEHEPSHTPPPPSETESNVKSTSKGSRTTPAETAQAATAGSSNLQNATGSSRQPSSIPENAPLHRSADEAQDEVEKPSSQPPTADHTPRTGSPAPSDGESTSESAPPAAMLPSVAMLRSDLPARERLAAFYQEHMPTKVNQVDRILAAYEGREEELFQELIEAFELDHGPLQQAPDNAHAPQDSHQGTGSVQRELQQQGKPKPSDADSGEPMPQSQPAEGSKQPLSVEGEAKVGADEGRPMQREASRSSIGRSSARETRTTPGAHEESNEVKGEESDKAPEQEAEPPKPPTPPPVKKAIHLEPSSASVAAQQLAEYRREIATGRRRLEEEELDVRHAIEYEEYLFGSTMRSRMLSVFEGALTLDRFEADLRSQGASVNIGDMPSFGHWYDLLTPILSRAAQGDRKRTIPKSPARASSPQRLSGPLSKFIALSV